MLRMNVDNNFTMHLSPIEDENLRFRLNLMLRINEFIRVNQLTQKQTQEKFQVSACTVFYLFQRKIAPLSTDELINILAHYDVQIYQRLNRSVLLET